MMWLNILKAFLMGGFICLLGQILINLTHLTNGKILVTFLIAGAILQAFNLYQPLIDTFGAGASVPISGFGCSLVNGEVEGARAEGVFGAIKGGSVRAGYCNGNYFWLRKRFDFQSEDKEKIIVTLSFTPAYYIDYGRNYLRLIA